MVPSLLQMASGWGQEGGLVVRPLADKLWIPALKLSWEEGSEQSYGVEAGFIDSPGPCILTVLAASAWV